jgi:adenosine deaminase
VTPTSLIDLHRHLEGAIRTSTVLAIARRDRHPLAALTRPRDELVVTEPIDGLLPYLAKVDRAAGVLRRLEDWTRAAHEAVEDAYDDGLDYVEYRFSPWFIASETGLPPEAVADAVHAGITTGTALTGLPVGLIGIVVRDLGPDSAQNQIDTIVTRQHLFVGVDLAGNEAGYPAALFSGAFRRARDAGLHITAHAGEAAGADSVSAAVHHLGAERIGHGVRAVEDPALLELLANRGITLDVALTSNVQTRTSPSYAEHQIHQLLAAGVPVTLNTDDPRASNVTLSHEYDVAAHRVGLTAQQLTAIAAHARRASFGR